MTPIGDGVCVMWSDHELRIVNFITGNCGANLLKQYSKRIMTTFKIIPRASCMEIGTPVLIIVARGGCGISSLFKLGWWSNVGIGF
eukprot:gnl/Chilomastix_caulleri/5598.p1 GENE.gnl/Chilomastix_caulleri/5598~~gnl/Chilomastix_caulleri/5598.p1  ORF type:complete len:98 (+),score=7.29 gnl/Chilomastix_caulleri/5598:39-296(+)